MKVVMKHNTILSAHSLPTHSAVVINLSVITVYLPYIPSLSATSLFEDLKMAGSQQGRYYSEGGVCLQPVLCLLNIYTAFFKGCYNLWFMYDEIRFLKCSQCSILWPNQTLSMSLKINVFFFIFFNIKIEYFMCLHQQTRLYPILNKLYSSMHRIPQEQKWHVMLALKL